MNLKKWLFLNQRTVKGFAQELGTGRIYLHHIFKGTKPSQKLLDKIKEATGGQVKTFRDLVSVTLKKKNAEDQANH